MMVAISIQSGEIKTDRRKWPNGNGLHLCYSWLYHSGMTVDDQQVAADEFSASDESLIETLANGKTYGQAAEAGSVSYSTVQRRMRVPRFRNEVRIRTRARFEHPARVAAVDRYWIYQRYKRLAEHAEEESVQLSALKAMDQIACDGITLSLADTLLDLQAGQ